MSNAPSLDDAFAFMARYAETFGVQRGDDDPSAYFEPEGLCLLPAWRRPMSLGMLECAAREGAWCLARLASAE